MGRDHEQLLVRLGDLALAEDASPLWSLTYHTAMRTLTGQDIRQMPERQQGRFFRMLRERGILIKDVSHVTLITKRIAIVTLYKTMNGRKYGRKYFNKLNKPAKHKRLVRFRRKARV